MTGRTGELVEALADGVRDDLEAIAEAMENVREMVEELGASARAINGLGGCCNGWASRLRTLIEEVEKEGREVPAKLTGTPMHTIVQSVDKGHLETVIEARRSA